jgi:hypothetical protein
MAIINGIYTKDFPPLGRDGLGTDLIPVAIAGNPITYKATLSELLATVAPALSFATFGATPNANGGSYSAGVITLQPASASFPGGVTTGTQTFAGQKTFTASPIIASSGITYLEIAAGTADTDAYVLLKSTTSDIWSMRKLATSQNYAIYNHPLASNALSIDVNNNALTLSSLTNGLVKSASGVLSNASASDLDSAGVVLTTTNQSIAGNKNFTDALKITGLGTLSGAGAEIVYTAGLGIFQTYDRAGAVYLPTILSGSTLDLRIGFTSAIAVDASRNVTVDQNITAANLISGTYTPTLTNGTNVSSSTTQTAFYQRVGNIVNFTVKINPVTTAAGSSQIDFSLPIASNFGSSSDALGTASYAQAIGNSSDISVSASIANDRIVVTFTDDTGGGAVNITITGHYEII